MFRFKLNFIYCFNIYNKTTEYTYNFWNWYSKVRMVHFDECFAYQLMENTVPGESDFIPPQSVLHSSLFMLEAGQLFPDHLVLFGSDRSSMSHNVRPYDESSQVCKLS